MVNFIQTSCALTVNDLESFRNQERIGMEKDEKIR